MSDDKELRYALVEELARWASQKLDSGIGITMILSAILLFVAHTLMTLNNYWETREGKDIK